jgi:hypothetical protein
MTTLARFPEARPAAIDTAVAAPARGRRLADRLRGESDRQVAFSGTRLLLREAASAIDQLAADLAVVSGELERARAERRSP